MYNEIAIYKPLKNIFIYARAAKRSKVVAQIIPGSKIYIDRYSRTWGRICFIRYDFMVGGDLNFNGKWIKINEDVRIVWAAGRAMDKRQQVS